jgi:hypothetical protein
MEDIRNLPIAAAIADLAPGAAWSLREDDLSSLTWDSIDPPRPTDEAIIARAREMKAAVPMKMLRRERDARLKEVDWVTLRAMRTGEAVPQEWRDYMQALADITEGAEPIMAGKFVTNITWPERPDGVPAGPYRGNPFLR